MQYFFFSKLRVTKIGVLNKRRVIGNIYIISRRRKKINSLPKIEKCRRKKAQEVIIGPNNIFNLFEKESIFNILKNTI